MAHAELVIHVEPGELRTGGWCTDCALPSLVEVDMLRISESGVSVLGTCSACTECGRRTTSKNRAR